MLCVGCRVRVDNSVSKEEVSPDIERGARPFFSSVDWFALCRMFLMATLSPKMVTTLAGKRNNWCLLYFI